MTTDEHLDKLIKTSKAVGMLDAATMVHDVASAFIATGELSVAKELTALHERIRLKAQEVKNS